MWTDLELTQGPGALETPDTIGELEARLRVSLPPDHREFLQTFGQGVVFNHFRVFGVEMITQSLAAFRERWQESFLWHGADSALTAEELASAVIIGDTFNGDELVLCPKHPGTIFYLPQDDDTIRSLGGSLETALRTLVAQLEAEIAHYPEDEREEWDLRPIFSVSDF